MYCVIATLSNIPHHHHQPTIIKNKTIITINITITNNEAFMPSCRHFWTYLPGNWIKFDEPCMYTDDKSVKKDPAELLPESLQRLQLVVLFCSVYFAFAP